MSDDRKDLDDLDWDTALDEWEKNTFVAEVARDAETHRVASPLRTDEAAKTSSVPAPTPEPQPPPSVASGSQLGVVSDSTVVAAVPSELRDPSALPSSSVSSRSSAPPPTRSSVSPTTRGGLDQLFSRPPPPRSTATRPPQAMPPRPGHPPETPRVLGPLEDRESVATLVRAGPIDTAPLRDEMADAPTVATRRLASKLGDDHAEPAKGRDRHSLSDADTATRLPGESERLTRRTSTPARAPASGSTPAPTTSPSARSMARTFDGERPVSRWLDDAKVEAFSARISWLEEEARAVTDPAARGRALIALSELAALVGSHERAYAFATEALDIAPELPLAWRQARQLMPRDADALVDALDAEASRSPTPSSRAHSVLLAADILRTNGKGDAAVERWDRTCKLDPADARAPIARATLALAQQDHTSGALRLSENSELVFLDKAIATSLRLRGVERQGADVDDMTINDELRHARAALGAGDVVAAAQAIGSLAVLPGLSKGALWLSAALGSTHIASRRASARALKVLAHDGDILARRQLAARGIELGDPELVSSALESTAAFEPAEVAILTVLARAKDSDATRPDLEELHHQRSAAPLVEALASLSPLTSSDEAVIARAGYVSGTPESRAMTTLGRLLASPVRGEVVDQALRQLPTERSPSAHGVAIEMAARAKRWGELGEALASLPSGDADDFQRHVATAMVADRADHRDLAKEAWRRASRAANTSDGLLRIAADVDRDLDLGAELRSLADEMPDGLGAAIVRLEALARGHLSADEQTVLLERVHAAVPTLGIGAFLGERVGHRKGDLEEVLRWIHERRSYATDPLETATYAVQEALLVVERDPDLARARLEEAHRARPDDVALRELYERFSPSPPTDRGAWREKRASQRTGSEAAPLWIEAAIEHARAGDAASTLRAARRAAQEGDRGLSEPLALRAELEAGDTAQRTSELEEILAKTDDANVRRETLERLALLAAVGMQDSARARDCHRAILEQSPHHKPSLRWVEHTLIREGRDDDLLPIFEQIAYALDGIAGGEATAHAQHAARLHARDATNARSTFEMARLAATQPESSLWGLRALNAHARAQKDEVAILDTTLALLDRTHRSPERAALLLRASESTAHLERFGDARTYLERAASEDPGDVVTWGFLAEIRERSGEPREAAEACESLARTSAVPAHQLLAWHDAGAIWLDAVKDTERGMNALEAAAQIDPTYADVFSRLSSLYMGNNLGASLTHLLERRIEAALDDDERVTLEVELARAHANMGELAKAKDALESALQKRPDHTTALSALANLCAHQHDWARAEQAYVRLARQLTDLNEQRAIYEILGEIYSVHAPNLSRAEMAYKEVLKRSPDDLSTLTKLVEVYKRLGDVQHAASTQQAIVAASVDPVARLDSLIELARIYETVGRDPRKSEQALDSARKEFPTSVVALRAMAEFYARQRQMPAMQILLDRAAGDARRSFSQGRFVPSLFEVLHAAFELRGKRDAARVVAASLAAVEGHPSELPGADARALDPQLDEILAPDLISNALRTLLSQAGDTLDVAHPLDLRVLKAVPLQPGTPIGAAVGSIATVVGLGGLHVLVSPHLGRVALPLSTKPPTLLVGEGLAKVKNERARTFVIVRALKMLLGHSSALLRATPGEVAALVAGLFTAFNPSYIAQGIDGKRVADVARRIGPALPRNIDPTVGVIALEAAGMLGTQWAQIAPAASAWANRVALLAIGDPSAALDAIAWKENEEAAPTGSEERASWIARHAEARELMTFSVTDAYAEARTRLGLDK